MDNHKHQRIPELRQRDIQRHRLPVRPSEQPGWVRQAELHKAERKAQRDERKKAETAIAILGLSLLGKLLDAVTVTKPAPTPAPTPVPLKSNETIIYAEFIDVIEEPETKELVLKS